MTRAVGRLHVGSSKISANYTPSLSQAARSVSCADTGFIEGGEWLAYASLCEPLLCSSSPPEGLRAFIRRSAASPAHEGKTDWHT